MVVPWPDTHPSHPYSRPSLPLLASPILTSAYTYPHLPPSTYTMQILGVHLQRRGLPLAPDVHVDEIAAMTMGFTGADLANLVNEVGAVLAVVLVF